MELSAAEMIERIKTIAPLKELEPLGFPSGVISNWKARNAFPTADKLYLIAQKLNVSMEWLLTGKEPDTEAVYKDKYYKLQSTLKNLCVD